MREGLQKIINERLSSPIYSYITFYLVIFNWKSISILFLSREPVENRIIAISTASNLWGGLITPCLIGIFTAMASPYLHNGLAIVHRRAIEWNNRGLAREEVRNYERAIEISAKSAENYHASRVNFPGPGPLLCERDSAGRLPYAFWWYTCGSTTLGTCCKKLACWGSGHTA